jgi:hypothetical protein
MRALAIAICVLSVAGCGGDGGSKPAPAPAAPVTTKEAVGGPIGKVALAAVQVVHPRECPRWYAAGQGVTICEDYITAGSRQSHARVREVTRMGERAVANMGEPGGNPFAVSLRRTGGKWRVYDEAGLLPMAGD